MNEIFMSIFIVDMEYALLSGEPKEKKEPVNTWTAWISLLLSYLRTPPPTKLSADRSTQETGEQIPGE